jgi:hypothetical protein
MENKSIISPVREHNKHALRSGRKFWREVVNHEPPLGPPA